MSTSLSKERKNNMPPAVGYIDVIMTTEEASLLENMIIASHPSALRSEIDIERMTTLGTYGPQVSDSDLVRYRALDSLYLILIKPVLDVNNLTLSSPIITANAKAHVSKKTYSIVYSDIEEAEISKILPEFQACVHSDFVVGNNGDRFRLKTGEFSPFDMSYLGGKLSVSSHVAFRVKHDTGCYRNALCFGGANHTHHSSRLLRIFFSQ